jgi:hypothetical protein
VITTRVVTEVGRDLLPRGVLFNAYRDFRSVRGTSPGECGFWFAELVMAIMAANRAEAALDGAALGVVIVALALFGLWFLLP